MQTFDAVVRVLCRNFPSLAFPFDPHVPSLFLSLIETALMCQSVTALLRTAALQEDLISSDAAAASEQDPGHGQSLSLRVSTLW